MQSDHFTDPVWPAVIKSRLAGYIPKIRDWWDRIEDLDVTDTGIYSIEDEMPGLFFRFTRTPIRSPIRGIQAFPFIVAGTLQISGVAGGSTKLIQYALRENKFTMDEFTLVEIHNLPSTFNQGQLIAFVPTIMLEDAKLLGKWIYFTQDEISSLIKGEVTEAIRNKAIIKG